MAAVDIQTEYHGRLPTGEVEQERSKANEKNQIAVNAHYKLLNRIISIWVVWIMCIVFQPRRVALLWQRAGAEMRRLFVAAKLMVDKVLDSMICYD
jgi:hypothetical protein